MTQIEFEKFLPMIQNKEQSKGTVHIHNFAFGMGIYDESVIINSLIDSIVYLSATRVNSSLVGL